MNYTEVNIKQAVEIGAATKGMKQGEIARGLGQSKANFSNSLTGGNPNLKRVLEIFEYLEAKVLIKCGDGVELKLEVLEDLDKTNIKKAVATAASLKKMTLGEVARGAGRRETSVWESLERGRPNLKQVLEMFSVLECPFIVEFDEAHRIQVI